MIGEFGVMPSEFWRMTPTEVEVLIEHKRPKRIGGVHEDDIDNMLRRRDELDAQGIKVL